LRKNKPESEENFPKRRRKGHGFLIFLLMLACFFLGAFVSVNLDKGSEIASAFLNLGNSSESPAESEASGQPESLDAAALEKQLKAIAEYAAVDYNYTNAGMISLQSGLLKKSVVVSYDGRIKIGLDPAGIKLSLEGKILKITLPAAKALSHQIVKDSLKELERADNLLNPVKPEDYASYPEEQMAAMEEKAKAGGLFDSAKSRAGGVFKAFLESLPEVAEGGYSVLIEG
jgi:hypothetical protein